MPFDKEKTLYIRWSKKENDVMYHYPSKGDGHLLHYFMACDKMKISLNKDLPYEFGPSLFKELELRGYDLSTIKFSIKKKEV